MSNIFGGGGGTAANPASANIVQTLVQTVKQDMEQMERGHQWPYSCYSPAKDCISVPGIDDISPEELRYDAYQAIANGTVAAYQQKCQETKNSYAAKRQMLYNPSNEMREIFRRIYNKESLAGISSPLTAGSSGGGLFSTTQSSVFGGGANTNAMGSNTSGSLFGSGNTSSSLFGARPSATPTSGTSSIFGGGTGAGTSLFGAGAAPATSQSSTSIFGGGGSSIFGAAPPPNQSVFSSPAQQPSSVFGGQQQPQTGGSVFGGQAAIGAGGGGIFGQKRTATAFGGQLGTQGGTSLFGQPAASSVFGGGLQQTPVLTSLFGQPQQPQASIFGGQTTISAVPTQQPTSLFGQQPAVPSAFGGQPQFQSQSIFGATPAAQQQQQPSGIFGGQQQQSTSIFGQPPVPAPSPFSAPGFGQQQQQQQQKTPSPFGVMSDSQNPVSKPTNNIFGNRAGESEMGGSAVTPFGSRPVGVGGGGLFGEVIEPQKDSSTYTPLDRLSKEIYEIFQSGKFELGKIPEVPPPEELCV